MATKTSIEWTEMTWNPVTGCTKVSQGCKNCYAARMAVRLHAMGSSRYINGFAPTIHPDLIDLPKKWKQGRVVFVNSMSDLFHEMVPDHFIESVFQTMRACPQHTFQILTKRSARLRSLASRLEWSDNIWMGVSVESSAVVSRIDDLRSVPASVRFLSCEPLLGPLDELRLDGIDWVIVGGESGPGSRAMEKLWVQSIQAQCSESSVPFFFKQWGGTRKKKTGRTLDGQVFDEMPNTNRGSSYVSITLS